MLSSFYGEIHISDNPPSESDYVEAYVPDVTESVGMAAIQSYLGDHFYSMDVRGDDPEILGKDGAEEGDTIIFAINNRVVGADTWMTDTNVPLNLPT